MDGSRHPCGRPTRPAPGRQLAEGQRSHSPSTCPDGPLSSGQECQQPAQDGEASGAKATIARVHGSRTGISIPAPKRAHSLVSRQANNMTECVSLKKTGLEA